MSSTTSFQHNNPQLLTLFQNTIVNDIDTQFCIATQSKIKKSQCKNKRKDGSLFCGVHTTCSTDRIFTPVFEILFPDPMNKYSKKMDIENNDDKNVSIFTDEPELIIEDDNHLRSLIMNHRTSDLSVTTLRNYLKNHSQFKNMINTKGSKNSMIQELHKHYSSLEMYSSNESKIILVQSVVRRWSVMRRNVCSNKTDILSMDPIYDIPSNYFYIFEDKKSGNKYGYDIRTFTKILYDSMNNPKFVAKCPYTLRPYEPQEIVRIEMYIEKLRKSGVSLEIEKPKLSKEKEIELKCVDIFLRMDMLDNYTQSRWFMDLDIPRLLQFYDTARDIWSYRIQMPLQNKLRILSNGRAFEMPRSFLAKLPSKLALQNFVLMEMDRFISEGVNREEKKLGAMLMLTALVEVSQEAALSLPHLVQIF